MWAEDVDDTGFIGGEVVPRRICYIKEYDRINMRERIAIEFHSEHDMLDFMKVLTDMNYKPDASVKVCGAGMCGQVRLFVK